MLSHPLRSWRCAIRKFRTAIQITSHLPTFFTQSALTLSSKLLSSPLDVALFQVYHGNPGGLDRTPWLKDRIVLSYRRGGTASISSAKALRRLDSPADSPLS
jgi:hypothetical protein